MPFDQYKYPFGCLSKCHNLHIIPILPSQQLSVVLVSNLGNCQHHLFLGPSLIANTLVTQLFHLPALRMNHQFKKFLTLKIFITILCVLSLFHLGQPFLGFHMREQRCFSLRDLIKKSPRMKERKEEKPSHRHLRIHSISMSPALEV